MLPERLYLSGLYLFDFGFKLSDSGFYFSDLIFKSVKSILALSCSMALISGRTILRTSPNRLVMMIMTAVIVVTMKVIVVTVVVN